MSKFFFFRMGVSVVLGLCPAIVMAQSTVKVSDAIEGGVGGVSAARCSGSVVVGFADAESNRPNSYAGVAVSRSGGNAFTDRGVLPVPPFNNKVSFPGPYVLGTNSPNPHGPDNPALACVDSNLFYYASAYETPGDICSFANCAAISVSTSTNGGTTWSLPVVASVQGGDVFQYVSPAIAVDPNNPKQLYVAYIDVDFDTNFFPNCNSEADLLDIVSSSDGGKTWTQPQHIDHACPGTDFEDLTLTGQLESPSIVVSADGKVYVTDQFVGASGSGNPNEVHFLRSLDHGNTFSAVLKVSTQATNNPLPQLAVDRSNAQSRGTIYLTWSGSQTGTYTDTLVSESLDSGASFSFPRPISAAPTGGRFQSNPVIATDNTGAVAACFYETPTNQPDNNSVYSYNCASSINHAATWQVQKVAASVPVGYDSIAGDFLLRTSGFFATYEISANGSRSVVGANLGSN